VSARPSASVLFETPGALLSRTDLAHLGLTRVQVDATFRKLEVIRVAGTSRPMVRRDDYVALLEQGVCSGDRVRGRSR
jgi:hypothetical protein